MGLREEFTSMGGWLFRWRSYLPLVLLGLILVTLRHFDYIGHSQSLDDAWEVLCMFISFCGLAIRIYTVGHTPKGTSGRNTKKQKASRLNTTGAYSVVRHPLYLGNFFIWFGISLFVHLWWVTLICVLVFWLYYERIMFAEEEFLREKFGKQFEAWAKRTPAFVPRFSLWNPPDLPFSIKKVLKKEYSGFFAIIVMFTSLEIFGDYFVKGVVELDLMWGIILCIGAFTYITLRTVKKKTDLLSTQE